jgi:hypothetical protein
MTTAEQYRKRAAEFAALARGETDPARHSGFAMMAQSYLRLAVLADRNSHMDLTYETPPRKPGDLPDAL